VALVALGFARDPGCGNVDAPAGVQNAPCTRTADCRKGLICVEGVCSEPDAGPTGKETGGADAGPAPQEAGDGGG
jgi:hypothetical protein